MERAARQKGSIMSDQTDWDDYYLKPARAASFTRSITRAKLIRTIKPHISGTIAVCELGGANSSVLEKFCSHCEITDYHIMDTNEFGLSLLPDECQGTAVQAHLDAAKLGGYILITFPTPTLLYRIIRKAAEILGVWKFHDERPLKAAEVISRKKPQMRLRDNHVDVF